MAGLPLPKKEPTGPFFIDTASCQCALQPRIKVAVAHDKPQVSWRCIGQATEDVGNVFAVVRQKSALIIHELKNHAE